MAELHGNGQLMRCLGCDRLYTRQEVGWDTGRWGPGYRTRKPVPGQPECANCGDANFVASGLLLALFATGLNLGEVDRRGLGAGTALLPLAGTALMGFESDPIPRVGPRSLHGPVHDVAFVHFILAMLAALFSLWRGFEKHLCWGVHARNTLATGMFAVLLLFLPGVAYYLFIVTLLTWIFVTAMRLWPPPAINPPRRRSRI